MDDIYKKVAKMYGVSVDDVKRDMQVAIDQTYSNPNLQPKAPFKTEAPSIDEFIAQAVKRISF